MHKTIWFKIHWFLGIIAGLILLIVGTTGAIMSFEKEILNVINKDSLTVNVNQNQEKFSTKELLEKFQNSMPEGKISGITFFSDKTSSYIINVEGKGEGKEARKGKDYYINPYTAQILPDTKGKEFFSFVLKLHRWLALPQDFREVGKQTVAISTISLIILIVSAVVIYWARIKRAFFKSFTFSFKHKGRAFLSTMHSAVGMWVIPFYLMASLTGLMWSYEWFNDSIYQIAGVEKTQKERQNRGKIEANNFEEYQKVIEMFNIFVQNDYSKATLRFSPKEKIYTLNYLDANAAHFRAMNNLEIDANSWQLVKHERFDEKPLNERLLKSILPLHTGEYFGIIGQIGMFLAASLMMLFTITGFILYTNRLKKKKGIKSL